MRGPLKSSSLGSLLWFACRGPAVTCPPAPRNQAAKSEQMGGLYSVAFAKTARTPGTLQKDHEAPACGTEDGAETLSGHPEVGYGVVEQMPLS